MSTREVRTQIFNPEKKNYRQTKDTFQANRLKIRVEKNTSFFKELKEQVLSHLNNQWQESPEQTLKKIQIDLALSDAVDFFSSFHYPKKLFWRSREGDLTFLAFGAIDEFNLFELDKLKAFIRVNKETDPQVYGIYPFEFFKTQQKKRHWKKFRKKTFFLPRFEVIQNSGQVFLNIYYYPQKINELWADIDCWEASFQPRMMFSNEHPREKLKLKRIQYFPSKKRWIRWVYKTQQLIQDNVLQKLVLLRVVKLFTKEKIKAESLFCHLQDYLKGNYAFFYQDELGSSFISFSPERLFKRENNLIFSEALAGSQKLNDTKKTESSLNLNEQIKNKEEHRIVENEIYANMFKISTDTRIEKLRGTLKLKYIEHLYTKFSGKLKANISDQDLLLLFHPTSAVCGMPRRSAIKQILAMEPYARLFYSAPFGFLSTQMSEFGVGIRSLLISGKKVHLFSGAGIIEKSVPQEEWKELDQKIKPFLDYFSNQN